MMMTARAVTIDKDTKVRLGSAAMIVSAILGASWWLQQELRANQDAVLETVRSDMKTLESKTFGIAAAAEAALREAIENPGHRVPDPRDPTKIIVVNRGD